ncbi:MAG: hypothetical protein CMN76_17640 [Spirochaetaceae bacterium]|nr:hypothetical protein [Spirochaetaceae bacterium]|tara:strand:+ start:28362 stop:29339 length:978 start_codon:yes stop_codon:yes gene_type:complete
MSDYSILDADSFAQVQVQTIGLSSGPSPLRELFIYTSLICNKQCSHCFVSSSPTNRILDEMTARDLRPILDQATGQGLADIYFTGGEPFLSRDMDSMLEAAMEMAPVTVYTNATEPLEKSLRKGLPDINVAHVNKHGRPIHLRISIDHYEAEIHDIYYARGKGAFEKTLQVASLAYSQGFTISVNTQEDLHNRANTRQAERFLRNRFAEMGVDLYDVKVLPDIPTGNQQNRTISSETPVSPAEFAASGARRENLMCGAGRTVVKLQGNVQIFPCTLLVPHDAKTLHEFQKYMMGSSLSQSLGVAATLDHPSCRAYCVKGKMTCAN